MTLGLGIDAGGTRTRWAVANGSGEIVASGTAGAMSALLDGGGGFWIAREALRHIWRLEDCRPGAWRESPMAREIFARLAAR